MPMPMYGQPMGYNPWNGGYQQQQQAFMPQTNSSVSVNTTLVASAAGPVTVTLYQDGQAVSGATQTVTAAAADSVGIAFTAPVRVYRGQVSSRLQVIVTGQAVTTSNVAVEVVKE